MIKIVLLSAFLCMATGAFAQTQTEEEAAAYTKVITQRAAKIITPLQIGDSAKAGQVQAIIVQQYRNLGAIHDARDAKIKSLKEKTGEGKKPDEQSVKEIETSTGAELQQAHNTFIAKLTGLLTQQQVDQVKDGMTYGVLPVTYKGYQDMIPTLTGGQKDKIYEWLVEARELAMDQGSSEDKHKVFGKYKGRINNYLSSEGYDLKKEEKAWQERRRKK